MKRFQEDIKEKLPFNKDYYSIIFKGVFSDEETHKSRNSSFRNKRENFE